MADRRRRYTCNKEKKEDSANGAVNVSYIYSNKEWQCAHIYTQAGLAHQLMSL